MKTYTKEELSEVLRLHKMWLNDDESGVRANLKTMAYSEASKLIDRLDSLLFEKHQTNSALAGELKNIVKSFLAGQADIEYWKRFIETEIKELETEKK